MATAAVIARPVLRHPVWFVACALLIPAITLVIVLALPRQYVAESSLTLRFPSLRAETVRLLELDPAAVPDGPRYGDPLLHHPPSSNRLIARLVALFVPDMSADDVVKDVQVVFERGNAGTVGGEVTISVKASAESARRAAQLANTYAAALVEYRKLSFAGKARAVQQIDSSRGGRVSAAKRGAAGPRRAERDVLGVLEANNLRPASRATPPEKPKSPRAWRDLRVAVVLGLVLWLTVAAVLKPRGRPGPGGGGGQEREARNVRTSAASAESQASS